MTQPDSYLSPLPRNAGVDAAVTAARRVITALLHAGNNSAAEMTDIAVQLDAVADYLESHAPTADERLIDMWAGEGVPRHGPVNGTENALAPPLHMVGRADGSVSGTVSLGLLYQGPPAHVHGGISALLIDHAMGVANYWAGHSGMTGTLTLRYRRPVPLFVPLEITARQTSVDGRKIRTIASISTIGTGDRGVPGDTGTQGDTGAPGDTVCVEAEGLFIAKQLPRPGHPA